MGVGALTVRQEGKRVLLVSCGRLVAEMPAGAAKAVARALLAQAARAEEWEAPDRLALDDALLVRLGSRVRLAADPRIRAEAFDLSQHDPVLRRHVTGRRARGIRSAEAFGIPGVLRHRPTPEQLAAAASPSEREVLVQALKEAPHA